MKKLLKKAVAVTMIASICITSVFAAAQNNLKKTVENLTVENGIINTKIVMTDNFNGQKPEAKVFDLDIVTKKLGKDSDWRISLNSLNDPESLKTMNKTPISFAMTKRGDKVKIGFPELVLTYIQSMTDMNDYSPEERAEVAKTLKSISSNNYITFDDIKKEAKVSKVDTDKMKKLVENYRPVYLKLQKNGVSYNVDKTKALKEMDNIKKYILKNQKTINTIEALKEEGKTPTQALIENIDESKISIEDSLKSLKIFAGPQGYKLMCEQETGEKLMIQSAIRKGTAFKLNDFKGRELTDEEMQTYGMLLFMGIMTNVMDQVEADKTA